MENNGKSGSFSGAFDRLVCEDDGSVDEDFLYSNQEKQQVSMSMVKPASSCSQHSVLVVSLTVLAVILLAIDIGLGVYYNELTSEQRALLDINSELAKLQQKYNTVIKNRDEMKQQLEREIKEQQRTQWELQHQSRRTNSYEQLISKAQMEIATLKSYIPMVEEGCRRCLPGWNFLDSMCYFFAFSLAQRQWNDARNFCKKYGGNLATVDTYEKNEVMHRLISHYADPTRHYFQNAFWIGLTDIDNEGDWKWMNGQRLIEGYWNDGEPNNNNNEDCAGVFPKDHLHFKSWNDFPCSTHLRWICEMEPRSVTER
ncbi:C-type lectin domain family 4 member M-like isoform X2 [Cynoglossus semilaevis]|uniref:C-type lectin domain family 4 member M-like isoform X2 n=1 Tax=Cynoglossus semilaevis TaxID=244447 RepID=UPI0004951103|nr:C-type lectin domain family 4 member M-like isoform X2 [Cynoglossus semilaevis]